MRVLVLNCGSSSLKFDVLDADGDSLVAKASGSVDRIGPEANSSLSFDADELRREGPIADHVEALGVAVALLDEAGIDGIQAVGHRVVHGGERFRGPALIDEAVIEQIDAVSELAPLHNRPALSAIRAARTMFGGLPMVASFDTAFFAELPDVAATYALPRDLTRRLAIRRYGFHGLAHRYMIEAFRAQRPAVQSPRLITLQLGNGCSVTASRDGRPLDTSMGFTPLEGLIMGTRSGDLDPALPLLIAEKEGLAPREVDALLNTRSGLLGLSGRSSDMRDLVAAAAEGDAGADLAVRSFCYRAIKYAGAYLAVLGGADGVVFGGGIGENAPAVRRAICEGLSWAGLVLDPAMNESEMPGDRQISAEDSGIEAWVVQVDEAQVIAREVSLRLSAQPPSATGD